MDTPRDIARNKWWEAHLGMCETCVNSKKAVNGRYYCDDSDNEMYGEYSDEIIECNEWIERK